MARPMDRSRLREVAREHELRMILERLEEDLGADFVPDAVVDEQLDASAEEGTTDDLAKGEVARGDRRRHLGGRGREADRHRRGRATSPTLVDALRERPADRPRHQEPRRRRPHGLLAAAGDEGLELRHDTMVGAYLLDPARRTYDLVDIAAQRGPRGGVQGRGARREERRRRPARARGRGARSADPAAEARLVWEIAKRQRKSMKEQGLEKLMDEVEMPLVEVLAEMERVGVKLDAKRLADIGKGFEQRIETLQAEIFELAGREFTIGSPQQLGRGPVRRARPDQEAPRQDRLLDRRPGALPDPRRARDRPEDRAAGAS